jgi:hypothetical protein
MRRMSELQTYQGSCHCGRVRYEAQLDLSSPVMTCNCSICSRVGHMLSFTPAAQFALVSGEDALVDYQFGKRNLHHPFCSTCGVRSFSRGTGPDGSPMYAVNVRCLADVDLGALTVQQYDGKSIPLD